MNVRFLFCLAAGVVCPLVVAQGDPNYILNGGFENGLAGWTLSGDVRVVTDSPLAGKSSVQIGPGRGAVSQRYDIPGLRIVEFGTTARTSGADVMAQVRVQCFDSRNRVVMDLKQPFDPKKSTDAKGVGTGIYFKTQAFTTHILVSIEKTSAKPGTVIADSVELHDYDKERVDHAPLCDLDQYMQPIWKGDTVYNETVLMLSKQGAPASGKLLFEPTSILSVRDTSLAKEFVEGKDYTVSGKTITCPPGSAMTTMRDSDFPKGDYPWLSVAGKHVVVTYTHLDKWTGPALGFVGDKMLNTMAKLAAKKPLTIVALGDSITLGINVSGYRDEPPYMPTWADLFAWKLRKIYKYNGIKLYNTGLGGMTAQWGADNAKDAVASLNPDLVLIAFGMNDFWAVDPIAFRKSIEATMATVRAKRQKAEFVLIASIRFDPDYTKDPMYVGHMTGYANELKSLEHKGVCVLDMTDLSEALYRMKSAKDLMADPMHPDDFLARWYAQGLVAMFDNRS